MQSNSQAARWMPFQAWIAQQRGETDVPSKAAAREAGESGQAAFGQAADAQLRGAEQGRLAGTPGRVSRAPAPNMAQDCRTETRLVSDHVCGRQEMTVSLTVPGMPAHKAAPVLTAKQAGALLSTLSEPLVKVKVGRLTRKLSAPTVLRPTEERGTLSLWLQPNDDISLMWQSDLPQTTGDAPAVAPAAAPAAASDVREAACSMCVWEELAHFPAELRLEGDEQLVTVHMLRGDAAGRSFYIRVHDDVAAANLAATRAAVVAGQVGHAALEVGLSAEIADPADDGQPAARMYFWLAEPGLGPAMHSLGRLKSLLKRRPTLAKRSGVPEGQLYNIGAWLQQADEMLAAQQAAAPAAPSGEAQPSSSPQREAAPPPQESTASGLLFGRHRLPAAAAARAFMGMQSAMAAPGGASGAAAEAPSGSMTAAATVTATAAAVYQDRRFKIVCPCTVSVVAGLTLQQDVDRSAAAEAGPRCQYGHRQLPAPAATTQQPWQQLQQPQAPQCQVHAEQVLAADASSRAREAAERQARAAVDRTGRQRVEERLAEALLADVRAHRNRSRQRRRQEQQEEAEAQTLRQLGDRQQQQQQQPPLSPEQRPGGEEGRQAPVHPRPGVVVRRLQSRPPPPPAPGSEAGQRMTIHNLHTHIAAAAEGEPLPQGHAPEASSGGKVTVSNLADLLHQRKE